MPDSMSASQSLDVSTVYFEFLSAIFGRYSKPIGYLILALLALGIAYLTFLIVRGIYRSHMRKKFYRREGIELPSNVLVKVNRDDNDPMIELHFPYWTHSNKNGTRDKRYSSNPIVLPNSTVVSSHWILKSNSPQLMPREQPAAFVVKESPFPFAKSSATPTSKKVIPEKYIIEQLTSIHSSDGSARRLNLNHTALTC